MGETDISPAFAVPVGILLVAAAFFMIKTGWWGRLIARSWPPYARAWKYADHNRFARIHQWVFAVGMPLYLFGLGGLALIASWGGVVARVLAPLGLVAMVFMPIMIIAGFVAQIQIGRQDLWAKPSRPTRSHGYEQRHETMTLDKRLELLREEVDEELHR